MENEKEDRFDKNKIVIMKNEGGLTDHVDNKANPHNVTKDQVGLSNVQNYAIGILTA